MAESVPEQWYLEEHKPAVIVWLLQLPLEPLIRKWALWEWCKKWGIEFTAEDVVKVTGQPAGTL